AFLNDLPEFGDGGLPTTEALARVVWNRIRPGLPDGCELVGVRVREDRDLWSEYRGG
ncbi:MAG: 6-pyruvoyl tetrahydropterin synthase family protein, partial [Gemmatimonadota bacterium]